VDDLLLRVRKGKFKSKETILESSTQLFHVSNSRTANIPDDAL
jgi:hypothetical protein